jgi:polar amino acid transport system substrate-binding protein
MRIVQSLVVLLGLAGAAAAQDTTAPNFWDSRERLPQPEITDVSRLRFLTTVDFPPFNFLNEAGLLSGFHVDLVRAICTELDMSAACQIQALPWADLPTALESGEGEAIIAGIAITAQSRSRFAFSRPYLQLPARFVVVNGSTMAEPMHAAVSGRRVGVAAGSVHERILRDLFPEVRVVTYDRDAWMFEDLRKGAVDAVFGDGMRFSFWLAGTAAQGCCRFAGGPYLLPAYLGSGLAIAVRQQDDKLADAFDYALREIDAKGIFAELYLRYFPVSFF